MKKNKTSSLTSTLIVRKGEASPSIEERFIPKISSESPPSGKKKIGTVAITVRLDEARYDKLKLYGVYNRLSNQDIMVKALDDFLLKNP